MYVCMHVCGMYQVKIMSFIGKAQMTAAKKLSEAYAKKLAASDATSANTTGISSSIGSTTTAADDGAAAAVGADGATPVVDSVDVDTDNNNNDNNDFFHIIMNARKMAHVTDELVWVYQVRDD